MEIRLDDILVLKKSHPCGESRFSVLRTGMDVKLRCQGCGRELVLPRHKAEKQIKSIIRKEETPCL